MPPGVNAGRSGPQVCLRWRRRGEGGCQWRVSRQSGGSGKCRDAIARSMGGVDNDRDVRLSDVLSNPMRVPKKALRLGALFLGFVSLMQAADDGRPVAARYETRNR